MRRQTPNLVTSGLSLPTYPTRPVGGPRGLGRLAALGLLLSLAPGCFSLFSDQSWRLDITAEQRLVAVDEPVALRVQKPDESCLPRWSVAAIDGGDERGASLSGDGAAVTFTGRKPGEYEVSAHCGKHTVSRRITIFAAELTLRVGSERTLPVPCQDATPGPRGRILCVDHGIHVIDPESGAELGRTSEPVPQAWGVDVQGDRFVAATYGCSRGSKECPTQDIEAGIYMYRLGADDQPVRLSHILSAPGGVPLLDGNRLYASGTNTVSRYDVSDPTKASVTACASAQALDLIPVPFLLGSKLGALSWKNQLLIFDGDALPASCATETKPLAQLPLSERKSAVISARPTLHDDVLYTGNAEALFTIDLRDALRPAVTSRIGFSAGSTALHGGRLFSLLEKSVTAFDLSDPLHPRMIGRLTPGNLAVDYLDRLIVVNGQLFAVVANKLMRIDVR